MYKEEVERALEVLKTATLADNHSVFAASEGWFYGLCGLFKRIYGIEYSRQIINHLAFYCGNSDELFWFPPIKLCGFEKAKRLRIEFLESYLKIIDENRNNTP